MTQEEKARAYDEAIERASKLRVQNPFDTVSQMMEYVFPKLKESEDERMRKLIKLCLAECVHNDVIRDYEEQKALAWLEKQGEQKTTNKVEPKFKVGDWCIDNEDDTIFQIVKVLDNTYAYKTIEGKEYSCTHYSLENDARLWTIQDAKDGDVVVDKSDGTIGIFQNIGHHPDGGSYNDPSYCFLHCQYDYRYFYTDFENFNTIGSDDLIPATKEQRNTLMKVMTASGYEWDAEKKELKLLISNGGDYGIDSLWHAKNILEKTLGKVDGYQTDDGILSHKCDISAVKKLYEQKPMWSENDKRNWKMCLECVEDCATQQRADFSKTIEWLKSIKQRMEEKE